MHQPTKVNDMAQAACATLERLRTETPRVHCITNSVAQNFTANALLSLGCVPSMTLSPEEIGGFVTGAQALLVNLGTFDAERRRATEIAAETAKREALPWVLDPVFVDRSPARAEFARTLIARGPKVVRLNRTEFATLAGAEATPGTLAAFARENSVTVGLSGEIDIITDGASHAGIENGHPLMARVTAVGCAGSALVAACLAVEDNALRAAASALAIIGVAGEVAAEKSHGPGSFAAAILDALYNLNGATLNALARVTQ